MLGYYFNEQDENYKPETDDSFYIFESFVLYNFGGGFLFDVSEFLSLGAYANYERMAFISGGSTIEKYTINIDILDEFDGKENICPYDIRKNVLTLGINVFMKFKNPFGLYVEHAPGRFFMNDGFWKSSIVFF